MALFARLSLDIEKNILQHLNDLDKIILFNKDSGHPNLVGAGGSQKRKFPRKFTEKLHRQLFQTQYPLTLIQDFHRRGVLDNKLMFEATARNGNREALKWLTSIYPDDLRLYFPRMNQVAAIHGQLRFLKLLERIHDLPIHPAICGSACFSGDLEVVKYFIEKEHLLKNNCYYAAIVNDDFPIFRFVFNDLPTLCPLLEWAARFNSIKILTFLIAIRSTHLMGAINEAIKNNSMECLEILIKLASDDDRSCISYLALLKAAKRGNVAIFKIIYKYSPGSILTRLVNLLYDSLQHVGLFEYLLSLAEETIKLAPQDDQKNLRSKTIIYALDEDADQALKYLYHNPVYTSLVIRRITLVRAINMRSLKCLRFLVSLKEIRDNFTVSITEVPTGFGADAFGILNMCNSIMLKRKKDQKDIECLKILWNTGFEFYGMIENVLIYNKIIYPLSKYQISTVPTVPQVSPIGTADEEELELLNIYI